MELTFTCNADVPTDLGDAVATMSSLKKVTFSGVSGTLSKSLMSGLSH